MLFYIGCSGKVFDHRLGKKSEPYAYWRKTFKTEEETRPKGLRGEPNAMFKEY